MIIQFIVVGILYLLFFFTISKAGENHRSHKSLDIKQTQRLSSVKEYFCLRPVTFLLVYFEEEEAI